MIFEMVANRYATALYEVAVDCDELDSIKKDMLRVNTLFSELTELRNYCLSQGVSVYNALQVVEIALSKQLSSISKNSFKLMAENGRINSIPFMPSAFLKICEDRGSSVSVTVEFANTPNTEIVKKIREKMAKRLGKTVNIIEKIVPTILGGYRLKWKNRLIDNSAIGRVRELSQLLNAS